MPAAAEDEDHGKTGHDRGSDERANHQTGSSPPRQTTTPVIEPGSPYTDAQLDREGMIVVLG
jgi:hypothetical protein